VLRIDNGSESDDCQVTPSRGRLSLEAMGRGDAVDSQVSEWLTVIEVCTYLKVSRRTVYRWMENGEVPYFHDCSWWWI